MKNKDLPIRWRQKSKPTAAGAELVPYLDPRDIQSKLDELYGELGWSDSYTDVAGVVACTISIYDEKRNQWVSKSDAGGSDSEEERAKRKMSLGDSQKSTFTDAFKRAAVKWGFRGAYEVGGIIKLPTVEFRGKYYLKDPITQKPVSWDNKEKIEELANNQIKKEQIK